MNAEAVSEAVSTLGGAERVIVDAQSRMDIASTNEETKEKEYYLIRTFSSRLIDIFLDGASGWATDAKLVHDYYLHFAYFCQRYL